MLTAEKYRYPIDFGVYKPTGDGEACELVRYKTVEEVREELLERLGAESLWDRSSQEYFCLASGWDRWDQFPYRSKWTECSRIACYPVAGKDASCMIYVEVVLQDDSHLLLYVGKTIWGFEHACRVANACARHLGA